jgi:filamentous hemagglutinin family protein
MKNGVDTLVITQNAAEAIINWKSFNVGSKAEVDFSQKSSSWICLNDIFDQNPSQIFGRIDAIGKIYLINQNGILFMRGSQVDLNTLIASSLSLDILDKNFLKGEFVLSNGQTGMEFSLGTGNPDASVENYGAITTYALGSVFLLGPNVTNDGNITTRTGQIGLAAGSDVSLSPGANGAQLVEVVKTSGDAVNRGQIIADTGQIGMYGLNVEQNGTVSAAASLTSAGQINLDASNLVSTGAGSVTSTPISGSTETIIPSATPFGGGTIDLGGLNSSGAQYIENCGLIQAHSGTVNLQAQKRVFLEKGSSIDVSGSWINESASANTTRVQLNSVELRDYPDQKNGLLKGNYITVNNLLGSSIGDISQYLNIQEKTAMEQSLQGGTINITSSGDIIVKQGASLNFSGGGVRYSAGEVTTTGLISNNIVYSIDDAPETLHYDAITTVSNYVGSYVEGADAGLLQLQGRTVVLDGSIRGAATAGIYQTRTSELLDKMGDQNTLGLQMPAGGTLIIGTQPTGLGTIQTGKDAEASDFIVASVVMAPAVMPLPSNFGLYEPLSSFGPYEHPYDANLSQLAWPTTYLSTRQLSTAGLTYLQIASNTKITINPGASISLDPGLAKLGNDSYQSATVYLTARAIDLKGEISVPDGIVNLTATDNEFAYVYSGTYGNPNYLYVPIPSVITLEPGSQINAAGQRIDNSQAATGGLGGNAVTAFTSGGAVYIQDESWDLLSQGQTQNQNQNQNQGVIAAAGSLIDVSGGYGIDQKGAVTGGNAGSLTIQGQGIVLDGALQAYSLIGNNGGAITLQAQRITVVQSASAAPRSLVIPPPGLTLSPDSLDDTGFTNINLQSFADTTIGAGTFSPSLVKLAVPYAGENAGAVGLSVVAPYLIGNSSISVTAGSPYTLAITSLEYLTVPNEGRQGQGRNTPGNFAISVLDGAAVSVLPQGSISLTNDTGSITIDAGASLEAQAGTVQLTSAGNLTLNGTISATGYNLPALSPLLLGVPVVYTPLSGGGVTLSAGGQLSVGYGSVVDVSGSSPVTTYIMNEDGGPVGQRVASNPGSITISAGALSLDGTLKGRAHLARLQGGTLSITDEVGSYTLSSANFANWVGFDAFTFASKTALFFSGDMNIVAGRSLTFDAPSFSVTAGTGNVAFQAPWIQLWNDFGAQGPAPSSGGSAHLTLAGQWINVEGAVSLYGFEGVKLSALHDLTLSDYNDGNILQGSMQISGALTLQADRIYPTTLTGTSASPFTITSLGNVTIQGSTAPHNSSPIYSAGGYIAISGVNIDMEGGMLAAPMGGISLAATGSVTIAGGSVITTAGSIPVSYGSLNDTIFWTITNPANTTDTGIYGIPVTGVPQGSVRISGSDVAIRSGSKINVSGGGGIFAYEFQADIEGSADPFQNPLTSQAQYQVVYNGVPSEQNVNLLIYDSKIDSFRLATPSDTFVGRYVIVPGSDYSTPASAAAEAGLQIGEEVYLQASPGLKAGVYTLLPEQYAFLPGAMIVTDTGVAVTPGTRQLSGDGYSVVAGYLTYAGTSIKPSLMDAFEVQPSGAVLQQGDFIKVRLAAGNAGSVSIVGTTSTSVNGKILSAALAGYQGGTIFLSGASATFGGLNSQDDDASLSSARNSLYIADGALTGFKVVDVEATGGNITMESGAQLKATEVNLTANAPNGEIVLTSGSGPAESQLTSITANSVSLTAGVLDMEANSLVHASNQVTMTIGRLGRVESHGNFENGFRGALRIDNGTLNLIGHNVYFEPEGFTKTAPAGLVLTNAFWSNFSSFKGLNITADSGLVEFLGDMNLLSRTAVTNSVTINAASIKELNAGNGGVVINAPTADSTIDLMNTTGSTLGSSGPQNGLLTLQADAISFGEGPVLLDGFQSVYFKAAKDITFRGIGSLTTGADLTFLSARVTASYYQDANTPYTVANYSVNTTGNVNIASNGVTPGQTVTPGGTLVISGNYIDVTGEIQMSAGTLTLNGATGITLDGTAQILDNGSIQSVKGTKPATYVCSPGGSVYLNSDRGHVNIYSGAEVDVSGAVEDNTLPEYYSHGTNTFTDPNDIGVNAGLISIYSPNGSSTLEGTLNGEAGYWKSSNGSSVTYGEGGSFILDANGIINTPNGKNNFSALLATLTRKGSGGLPTGFTENIDIRVRGVNSPGDLNITDNIYASNVNLTADNGSINFSGVIDSTGLGGGGTIEFNAGRELTVTGSITSPGATVFLNAPNSDPAQPMGLNFSGTIDVGAASGAVHFRSSLTSNATPDSYTLNMDLTGGRITASQILAEGVLYGLGSGSSAYVSATPNPSAGPGTISSQAILNWQQDIEGATIRDSRNLTLKSGGAAQFVPGLEIDSAGNLSLNAPWDLSSINNPGFLTLRAGKNLTISQDLMDNPTASNNSWGMTLVSGADFNSADPTAIVTQTGAFKQGVYDLAIASQVQVYSESGPLSLAAGGDLFINSVAFGRINGVVPYSVATSTGSISVNTGHDLEITGGAIQSATGEIVINTGGDLDLAADSLNNLGSIRTTGQSTTGQYWTYWSGGGNISINVKGNVNGEAIVNASVDDEGWDSYNVVNGISQGWSAGYTSGNGGSVTQGLAAMAGGNLTVHAGGSFNCQAGTFSPYAYTWSGQTLISSVPMDDPGNLTIFSGGSMQGRFLIADGIGELHSMGNFGTSATPPAIELFKATVNVSAQADIYVGSIFNPTIARPSSGNNAGYWDLEYSPETSVRLTSATGDVTLYGNDVYYPSSTSNLNILPPTLAIAAAGNIEILNNFSLAPYAYGNLSLVAGGDIYGQSESGGGAAYRAQFLMSDQPDALPGQPYNEVYGPQAAFVGLSAGVEYSPVPDDPAGILHAGDTAPVVVSAGGDISNLMFLLPKAAQITAGGNIDNIYYDGYNSNSTDVTKIQAAGNILFSYIPNSSNPGANTDTGILVGGPGALVVEAGGSIDLGTSAGIQVVGNIYDASQLPGFGAMLIVASGYNKDFSDTAQDAQFFDSLRADGVNYSAAMAAGDTAQAQRIVAGARAGLISPFFKGSANVGAGDIDMTFSQISTTSSDVFIFTNGNLNVGDTAFTTQAQIASTGIITSEGGAINIFASKNVNVNESRIMTYLGGDITVWSDTGGINAGLGSKTAVDTSPPTLTYNGSTGQYTLTFSPPSVGSGIRALTYNPDPEAGLEAPPEGNIYLFAPQGVIDAGQAGIAGRNVFLGAVQVLNANNIVFSQSEIGAPVTPTGLTALSTLQGTPGTTLATQVQAAFTSASNSNLGQSADFLVNLSTSSVEVTVLGFFEEEPGQAAGEKTDN